MLNKAAAGWWPRLTKDAKKAPWIKTDFQKWKDEDDELSDDAGMGGGMGDNYDLNEVISLLLLSFLDVDSSSKT